MDKKLAIGDLVRLKSGGPTMVIDALPNNGSDSINCVWISEKGEPQERWYATGALTQV